MDLINRSRLDRAQWSDREDAKLGQMVGDFPVSLICPRYWAWAERHGFPQRTEAAIRLRAQELSSSIAPVGEWLQVGDVARFAGATRHQVLRWVRYGYVVSSRYPDRRGGYHYIERASLRKMVKIYPRGFDRADREGLWALLEDHKLVDWLLATRADRDASWRPAGRPRPVIKLATGERFRSITNAAALHGCNCWAIQRSINSGGQMLLDNSAWAYAS